MVKSGQLVLGVVLGMFVLKVDCEKVGLMLGSYVVGFLLVQLKDELDLDVLFDVIGIIFVNGILKMIVEQVKVMLEGFMVVKQVEGQVKVVVQVGINCIEGNVFMVKNKIVLGVVIIVLGLQYQVLCLGSGDCLMLISKVCVNYEGKLLDGIVFDSSYSCGQLVEFGLDQVIKGWFEGVLLMLIGVKYCFWIFGELVYGEQGILGGLIGLNVMLMFDVELLNVFL